MSGKQKTLFETWKIAEVKTNLLTIPWEEKSNSIVTDAATNETEHWKYYPKLLTLESFEAVLEEMKPLVGEYFAKINGKEFPARRLSCKFSSLAAEEKISESTRAASRLFNYDSVAWQDWSAAPLLMKIREKVEKELNIQFDYCLVHLYRDGTDLINYHSDKEAMNTPIASLSLGATRKFRFREKSKTSGYSYQYNLEHGDLILMKPGCQFHWLHSVPAERSIKHPRMNFTFRKFELDEYNICFV
jgi:hypothetical protein